MSTRLPPDFTSSQLLAETVSNHLHPGRLTWNLQITHLQRKMIFQTSMTMFHVNLQGCMSGTAQKDV